MTIDEATALFSYASWATARMCRAAEALTDEQREAMAASSFPSLTAKTPPNSDFTRFLPEETA